jgi:hypothetical protein
MTSSPEFHQIIAITAEENSWRWWEGFLYQVARCTLIGTVSVETTLDFYPNIPRRHGEVDKALLFDSLYQRRSNISFARCGWIMLIDWRCQVTLGRDRQNEFRMYWSTTRISDSRCFQHFSSLSASKSNHRISLTRTKTAFIIGYSIKLSLPCHQILSWAMCFLSRLVGYQS